MKKNQSSYKGIVPVVLTSLLILSVSSSFITETSAQEPYPREETMYAAFAKADVINFNPFTSGWVASGGQNQLCHEYLFYYNYATGSLIPWLAAAYDLSDDFETLTIYLRRGVTWNDGLPFTAEDVVFTYNMLLEPHTPPLNMESVVQDMIESVEALDEYTVALHLTAPNPRAPFHDVYGTVMIWWGLPMVPKHVYADVDPTTFTNPDCVFTGPYKIREWSETGDMFVWERRDDWWGAKVLMRDLPAPKYAIFKSYATEEALAMEMAAGRVDASGYLTAGVFESLKAQNPNAIAWYEDRPYAWAEVCPLQLYINNQRYPWNMSKARWALSYALDRDILNSLGMEGTAPPYGSPFSPYMSPRFLELVAEKEAEYNPLEYNPTKSEQLFTELGFAKDAEGFWADPDGNRLTYEHLFRVEEELWARTYNEAIISLLRDAGIDAIAKIRSGTAFGDAIDSGEWDGWGGWMCAGVSEPWNTLNQFHGKWVVPPGEVAPGNPSRFSNATYDALVDEMFVMSPEDPEYLAKFEQVLDIFYQELPNVQTLNQPALLGYSNEYWTGWSTAENNYIQPYWQCATFLFAVLNIKPAQAAGVTTVTETVTNVETETMTTTVTEAAETVTETETVTQLDMTSLAGAGIVALVVGVVVGWLVGSRKS